MGHEHDDHRGHKHEHGHDHAHIPRDPGRLRIALVLTACVALIEFAGGFMSRSLALMSDSAHVAMDVVALGIALAAQVQATRPATIRQTFGFARMEIIAALVNGGLLFGITLLIAIEAVKRFMHPEQPEGQLMIVVAAVGLAINVGIGLLLVAGAKKNLNMRGALLHVIGDGVGALAVIVGGALILAFNIVWIDPLLSLLVAAIIVAGVIGIVRDAADVLLESAPATAAVPLVRAEMLSVTGVVGVHDLHVWQIGSDSCALTAHVQLEDAMISKATKVLQSIDTNLRERFGITHVTVQFECEACHPDDTIVCTQSPQVAATTPGGRLEASAGGRLEAP